jgi:hypothetical protein
MADGFTLSDLGEDNVTPVVETPEPTVVEPEPKPEPEVVRQGFTLDDLGETTPLVTSQESTQRVQELTSPFKLSDLDDTPSFTLEGEDRFVDVYNVFEKYDNKPLTKEDIVNDPDLMEVVYQSLEARFPETKALGKLAKTTTGLAGGATGGSALMNRNYRAMDKNKAFETWQNYQRSFNAAQSVTVANEIGYTMGADDSTKRQLAGGYLLFNQMDNAFTGEGSWGEMFDAVNDYLTATVWDPTTLLSFGAGKALGWASTKTTGQAFQKMMAAAYTDALSKGATKKAVTLAVGNAVAKATPMATVDAALAFGQDLGRQMQLIDVGAQKEYSKAEGALTAAGSIIFPVLAGGSALFKEARKSGFAEKTILSYKNIDSMIKKHGADEAWKKLGQALDKNGLFQSLDTQFGTLSARGKINFLPWEQAKDEADRLIASRGEKRRDLAANSAFFKFFWFGDPENKVKGYFEALNDAGFVMHPEILKKYKTTGAFARTIRFINPSKLDKIVKTWENETGYVLDGVRTEKGKVSPALVEAVMKNSMSLSGENLWISSELSRLTKAGVKNKDILELYKRVQPSEGPKHNQAALSLYKRLITSHLSTTGANLQGFKTLVSLNTAADFVTGAIDLTRGSIAKAFGNEEAAVRYYNRAYGEWGGAFRRMADAISPDIPIEYADAVLDMYPQISEKLFRDVAGDGGVNDSLAMFNIDKDNKIWAAADAYTKGVQTLTLARLQDNLTKRFAFGTNVNQEIMKKYGVTPEEFFSNPNVEFTMAKAEFREILEKAVQRTNRETASVNWSTLPATNFMRKSARFIETVTNRSVGGYVVPFGSFLNTTVATAGDLSGVNYLRYVGAKTLGKKVDPVTEDGAELFAKMVVGWGAVSYGVGGQIGFEGLDGDSAIERIQSGLSYKQDRQPDGTIRNREFEWPISLIRATSQAIGHGMLETGEMDMSKAAQKLITDSDFRAKFMGAIPDDLWIDLTVQVGPGQALRDLDDLGTSIGKSWEMAKNGDIGALAYSMLAASGAKVASGFTRHLDPVNTAYGMFNNAEMNPDLRQGNKFFNDAGRYLNQLTGQAEGMERRATATRGFASGKDVDVGKQLMVRSGKNPNLVESMFNSAGANIFTQVRWDGPAKVKNYMDGLLAPALQIQAELALAANPDYFTSSQEDKEEVLSIVRENAKAMVIRQMESGGAVPQSMDIVRKLARDKKTTEKVIDLLPFEFGSTDNFDSKMETILDMEDGYQQLLKIKSMVDTYDEWSSTVKEF